MDDVDIHHRIDALIAEEQSIHGRATDGPTSDEERARLDQIEVGLDQCWDLLRQRMARREAGRDPDEATVRSAETVENYLQ